MTATLDRPARAEVDPHRRPPHRVRNGQTRAALVGEGTLVLVTVVATTSFARLFVDRSVVVPLLIAAGAAHLTAAVLRHRGVGAGLTALASAAAFGAQASITLYPHTSLLGLPTLTTLSAASSDLGQAWQLYGEVTAPTVTSRGFLLAVTFALWVSAGLSDWAAFRLQTTAEAVLPAIALLTFTSILGESSHGIVLAATLAAAVAAFAVVQRVTGSVHRDAWVGGSSGTGGAVLIRAGLAAAVVCAVLAGLVGPRLPGAQNEALVDLTAGDGATRRTTVSPLVDIRSRLVQQSDAVVFRVEADRPAYWRLTSLDRFDGQVWSSSGSFSEADGLLPWVPPDAATRPLTQTFTIDSLDTIWAPAALTPVELDRSDTELRWNGELATLIVDSSEDSIDGAVYTVTSAVPELGPADLDAARPATLSEDLQDATRLPADLSPQVAAQAREVVAGVGPGPYAQALALQDWFRTNFTYDLAGTGAGHDEAAIEGFLRTRRGYCEQFAGTFAAMARSLGLPARVAVGYTPGDADEDGTTFTVRGRNAHAWPEVHIPGAGWVPFEPTPGRGQPGTEAYTGVAPAQDDADTAPVVTTTPPAPETTAPAAPEAPPPDREVVAQGPSTVPTPPSGGGGPSTPAAVAGVVIAVVAVLALANVALVVALRARRRRRRRGQTDVTARVRAAWADAVDALTERGAGPVASETDREFGARVAPRLGPDGEALEQLSGLVTSVTWAPVDSHPDPTWAEAADGLARQVASRARADISRRRRLVALLDPRPLLARR